VKLNSPESLQEQRLYILSFNIRFPHSQAWLRFTIETKINRDMIYPNILYVIHVIACNLIVALVDTTVLYFVTTATLKRCTKVHEKFVAVAKGSQPHISWVKKQYCCGSTVFFEKTTSILMYKLKKFP
jgi:hypothetical protein